MRADFLDSNVVLYLLDGGAKAEIAEQLLATNPTISVQVLNEVLVNCIRKAGMSWEKAGVFLLGIRRVCNVVELTEMTHEVGCALGERYGFSVYDSMIVASALLAGCDTLYSEDMHDGLAVEGVLRIVNPFTPV
ncbi:PIN domain-containing protein [Salinarimonas ramus]|uniref:Ribonuclease VapC n=1 Tax=Salinarimonas ramus TaxID=690164 RepID=A0A917QHV1_9HYPH|nr:PIN domain-containing protein [Salinarimonas ramus]GGK50484.1 ribonuclease VapC [Salinarimonas ramus]